MERSDRVARESRRRAARVTNTKTKQQQQQHQGGFKKKSAALLGSYISRIHQSSLCNEPEREKEREGEELVLTRERVVCIKRPFPKP
mmetsp:Transcript_3500/g.10757  ORF Transcript_3500/g.10757 Transcript_3500/m.10757 type:complete len:87 (-) Transcript_3500:8-268(-)